MHANSFFKCTIMVVMVGLLLTSAQAQIRIRPGAITLPGSISPGTLPGIGGGISPLPTNPYRYYRYGQFYVDPYIIPPNYVNPFAPAPFNNVGTPPININVENNQPAPQPTPPPERPMPLVRDVVDSSTLPPPVETPRQGSERLYSTALIAFQRGDYEEAMQQAQKAVEAYEGSVQSHELLSLGYFVEGNIEAAAKEARLVADYGGVGDWRTMLGYFPKPKIYTDKLRELEKLNRESPTADGHFLLGFHYVVLGHAAEAKKQFSAALKLNPDDSTAKSLLSKL